MGLIDAVLFNSFCMDYIQFHLFFEQHCKDLKGNLKKITINEYENIHGDINLEINGAIFLKTKAIEKYLEKYPELLI